MQIEHVHHRDERRLRFKGTRDELLHVAQELLKLCQGTIEGTHERHPSATHFVLEDSVEHDSFHFERFPDDRGHQLNRRVDQCMELSVRTRRCIRNLRIMTVGDLVNTTERKLLAMRNFGATSVNEIKSGLRELGLSLRSDRLDVPQPRYPAGKDPAHGYDPSV